MLRFVLPLKVKVCGKVGIIRKADKDRMKAAAKRTTEREPENDTADFSEEDRPP